MRKIAIYLLVALVLMGTPTVLAETMTFTDLGMATELTSGHEANTPVGTFYVSSKEYPLEISVNAYNQRLLYRLTIYLNDASLKSGDFHRGGTLSVTVSPENLKVGKNTIYVKGTSLYSVYPFSDQDNLIIYGTSKISSPSIILSSASPTMTPLPTSIKQEQLEKPLHPNQKVQPFCCMERKPMLFLARMFY